MNYLTKTSAEMTQPQPNPKKGIPGSDVWLDASLFAEGYFSAKRTNDPAVHQVLADMDARREDGISKYNTPLQYANNRDNIIDMYQEQLDSYVYNTGALGPQSDLTPTQREILRRIRTNTLENLLLIRSL